MASIVKGKEHPTALFRRGEVGAEALALKLLQEMASATPRCVSRGQELSCSCLQQLTTDELKGVVPYIAHFSKLKEEEKKMEAMKLIRASQAEFRNRPTAPKSLKHLRFRLPMTNGESAVPNSSTKSKLVCQSTIMALIGEPRHWWDSCVALVKNNEMPPTSKPKNETQSADEKRKKQNKRCAASKLKRQKRGQLGAIRGHVFAKCGGSNPTCASAPGSAQKREEAKAWLQKARPILNQHKESRKQEFYDGDASSKRKKNEPHIYTGAQFCVKSELPQGCKAIKVLGNAVFNVDLSKCHDFDDFVGKGDHFLRRAAEAGRDLIKEKPEFLGAQIRELQDDQWDQVVNSLDTVKKPSEIVEENGDLQDPRVRTFKAASLHDQIEKDRGIARGITVYEKHKDKAGNLVMFFPLTGESFNFIAMQSMRESAPADGQKEVAKLETTNAGYKKYQEYKASLSKTPTDLIKVNEFEADFREEATRLNLPRVRVYKLSPSDNLCFAAGDYLHATIIPKQDERRCLLVFHDLIPYK